MNVFELNKIGLTAFDDKRFILDDTTLAYGYFELLERVHKLEERIEILEEDNRKNKERTVEQLKNKIKTVDNRRNPCQEIICECGVKYHKSNEARHKKSKQHNK